MPEHRAHGVVGQVIPGISFANDGVENRPALAMGNTVVIKPAEYTSLSALLFAEICIERDCLRRR